MTHLSESLILCAIRARHWLASFAFRVCDPGGVVCRAAIMLAPIADWRAPVLWGKPRKLSCRLRMVAAVPQRGISLPHLTGKA